MASGRVGGSHSRITGVVGNDVYRSVRNSDGSYSQVVSEKSTRPYTANSDVQAAYKMGTAIVEAFMRDINPIANISVQRGANQSKSLNHVSQRNLWRVHKDMLEHWDSDGKFQYNIKGLNAACGGYFFVSSGTLRYNGFTDCVSGDYADKGLLFEDKMLPFGVDMYAGLMWELPDQVNTVGDLLSHFKLSKSDKLCFVDFYGDPYLDPDSDPDDPQIVEDYGYKWMIVGFDNMIPDDTLITPDLLQILFITDSSFTVLPYWNDTHRRFGLLHTMSISDIGNSIYSKAGFTISYREGRKKISNSELIPVEGSSGMPFTNHRPCDVYWSYVGKPAGTVLPSPFE